MSKLSIVLPEAIEIDSSASFSAEEWKYFKREMEVVGEESASLLSIDSLFPWLEVVAFNATSYDLLNQVQSLLESEFPHHGAAFHFMMSSLPVPGVYDSTLGTALKNHSIQYWVFRDRRTNDVVATVGVYLTEADWRESLWGGWLVVAPKYRKQRVGQLVIDFAVVVCEIFGEIHGQKAIRLISSDEPHVAAARYCYDKCGFVEIRRFANPYVQDANVLIYELKLIGLQQFLLGCNQLKAA
jgi:GNAT superfamily N-acetyltransferase